MSFDCYIPIHFHSYTGNLKEIPAYRWRDRFPERVIMHAVRGMIPKTMHKLQQLNRLKVFGGKEHTYKHLFPNEPLAAIVDKDDPVAAPTLRFMITDERANFFWKEKLTHIEPDERGFIDNWTHMRENEPEQFEFIARQTKVKIPAPMFIARRDTLGMDQAKIEARELREQERLDYLKQRGFYDEKNPDANKIRLQNNKKA